jgi:hypothetical protein
MSLYCTELSQSLETVSRLLRQQEHIKWKIPCVCHCKCMYTFLIQYFTFPVVFHPSFQDNWEFGGSWCILCTIIVLIAAWTNIYNFCWITGSYLSAGVFSSTCVIYIYMGWSKMNGTEMNCYLLIQNSYNCICVLTWNRWRYTSSLYCSCSTCAPWVLCHLSMQYWNSTQVLCITGSSTCCLVDLHGLWHGCCVLEVFDIPPDKEFRIYQILRSWWPRYRAPLPYPTPDSCSSRSLLTPKCQCGGLWPAGKVINQWSPPWNGVQAHLHHVPSTLWWVMERKMYNKP